MGYVAPDECPIANQLMRCRKRCPKVFWKDCQLKYDVNPRKCLR